MFNRLKRAWKLAPSPLPSAAAGSPGRACTARVKTAPGDRCDPTHECAGCGVERPHPAHSVSLGSRGRGDVSEQPIGLVVGPGGEVQRVGRDVERSGRESQAPEPRNGDRALFASKLTEELTGRWV